MSDKRTVVLGDGNEQMEPEENWAGIKKGNARNYGPALMTHPPITDEMVERAARALYARSHLRKKPWEGLLETAREAYRQDARAALEAALSRKEE